jgi:hypothetical protein
MKNKSKLMLLIQVDLLVDIIATIIHGGQERNEDLS